MKFKLTNARLSYPQLWEPKAFDAKGEPKFSANFILSKKDPQVTELLKVMAAQADEKWGKKGAGILAQTNYTDQSCLRDGDAYNKDGSHPELAGAVYIVAKNADMPKYYDRDRRELLAENARDRGVLYGGCVVNAAIDVYAYTHSGGKNFVLATLRGIQFVKDGEAFSSKAAATANEFDDVSDIGDSADDLM